MIRFRTSNEAEAPTLVPLVQLPGDGPADIGTRHDSGVGGPHSFETQQRLPGQNRALPK
jgi:hypothetical protein